MGKILVVKLNLTSWAFFSWLVICGGHTARAQIILPVTYRGYVQSSGNSNGGTGTKNFVANPGSTISWFGFDLSGQAAVPSITSAKLYLFNTSLALNGFGNGATGTGTYTLWDVSSASKTLLNTGNSLVGQTAVFSDLGGGTSYGSSSYSMADNGAYLVFNLNASGLADLQSAWGTGFFDIGGAATGTGNIFGYSNYVNQNQTYLEVVPEPSALSLLAVGLSK